MVQRGNCKFTTKPNVAQAAGASAVLIMNSQKGIYKLACKADKTDLNIHILAVMLLQDADIISLEKMLSNSSSGWMHPLPYEATEYDPTKPTHFPRCHQSLFYFQKRCLVAMVELSPYLKA